EASGVLPLCTARTRSTVRVPCPDLKHQTTGCNVRPGPERSEGPASGVLPLCTARTRSAVRVPCPDLKHRTTGCNVWPGPERSEGAPSQKIGRELEASHMLPND